MMAKVNEVASNTSSSSSTLSSFPTAIQREGEANEVAALIAFLLGDESRYITGSSYVIDGGRLC